jgi:hypothetical protein
MRKGPAVATGPCRTMLEDALTGSYGRLRSICSKYNLASNALGWPTTPRPTCRTRAEAKALMIFPNHEGGALVQWGWFLYGSSHAPAYNPAVRGRKAVLT